jgi:N-acetyl sugar amidotransferase
MRIQYCTNCLLPSTKPDLSFNHDGICSACEAYANRKTVDWDSRQIEFLELVKKYKSNTGSNWDCLIPVSGGKDSTAQVLKILELGLNPLCVTATTCDLSPLGRENIENIKSLGVDYVEFSPNKKIRRILNKFGLETVGDIAWPEHLGIFTIPVRAAVQYNVPLIVWGENSQNEYGGPAAAQGSPFLNRRWLEEFGGLLGLRTTDVAEILQIESKFLIPYTYPSDEELQKSGVTGIFLGHYFQWDGLSNYLLAQANGFRSYGKLVEGSAVDYENLDNHQHGIHDYFKYLKFGYGRATDLVSMHIRRGRLSREQGFKIVLENDGMYPNKYLGKSLENILSPIGLTVKQFDDICNKFTNFELFEMNNGELKRNHLGAPIKVNYDN